MNKPSLESLGFMPDMPGMGHSGHMMQSMTAPAKPVPMDSYMAEDLLRWRRQSAYTSDDDYVFASETMRGKQPYWPDTS